MADSVVCSLSGAALGMLAPWLAPLRLGVACSLSLGVAAACGLARRRLPSQAYATGCALGALASGGVALLLHRPSHWQFGAYACAVAFFHLSEFVVTGIWNPGTLNFDSFLVNHSWAYGAAAAASMAEYWAETYFFPEFKPRLRTVAYLGLTLVILGEIVRKTAMITAARSFTHLVSTQKKESHRLVTHGIYQVCRHPSYAAWFWWSVGTQLLLCNPICLIGYAYASYSFFADRVEFEERYLLQFFELDYDEYQQQVPHTGVPFVYGYQAPDATRKWWIAQRTFEVERQFQQQQAERK